MSNQWTTPPGRLNVIQSHPCCWANTRPHQLYWGDLQLMRPGNVAWVRGYGNVQWVTLTSMPVFFFLQRAMVHCSCIACVCVYICMHVCGDPCSLVHMHACITHILPQGLHPCGSDTSYYHLCYTIHCGCLWTSWTVVVSLHTNG